jgi:hypothetical protein
LTTTYEGRRDESAAVHEWRVSQLTRLGLPPSLADDVADGVDWHDVARLVSRGCPPELALAILR